MSSNGRRFVPRLEALDDRSLPSVTYTVVGSTLCITGDAGANTIIISDAGTETGVIVNGDGNPFDATQTNTPISAIVVKTLGGDDTVIYDLSGPLTTTRLVSVDLGRGADSFTVNLNGQTISGSSTNLGITATGDGGGDTLDLNAIGATVSPEAHLSVDFHGQAGKDAITFDYGFGFLDVGNVTLTKDRKH
jgi:hypothetical protein